MVGAKGKFLGFQGARLTQNTFADTLQILIRHKGVILKSHSSLEQVVCAYNIHLIYQHDSENLSGPSEYSHSLPSKKLRKPYGFLNFSGGRE